jgi:hypothetical protein
MQGGLQRIARFGEHGEHAVPGPLRYRASVAFHRLVEEGVVAFERPGHRIREVRPKTRALLHVGKEERHDRAASHRHALGLGADDESRVVTKDAVFEVNELRPGFDAHLVHQVAPRPLIGA